MLEEVERISITNLLQKEYYPLSSLYKIVTTDFNYEIYNETYNFEFNKEKEYINFSAKIDNQNITLTSFPIDIEEATNIKSNIGVPINKIKELKEKCIFFETNNSLSNSYTIEIEESTIDREIKQTRKKTIECLVPPIDFIEHFINCDYHINSHIKKYFDYSYWVKTALESNIKLVDVFYLIEGKKSITPILKNQNPFLNCELNEQAEEITSKFMRDINSSIEMSRIKDNLDMFPDSFISQFKEKLSQKNNKFLDFFPRGYSTNYLRDMLEAIDDNKITRVNQPKCSDIIYWFHKNKTNIYSDRELEKMSSFILLKTNKRGRKHKK